MTPTPEETKILEGCARLLKKAFGGLKRIIFDLSDEGQTDKITYEIHGKIKTK